MLCISHLQRSPRRWELNERGCEEKTADWSAYIVQTFHKTMTPAGINNALDLNLKLIPMLLQLSAVCFDTFSIYYRIDLSTAPVLVDIIYSKSTELTARDSQNAQEIISIIKAIPFNVRRTFSRDVFRQITTYSTHKLEMYFRELRRQVNIITRYLGKENFRPSPRDNRITNLSVNPATCIRFPMRSRYSESYTIQDCYV